MTPAEQQAAARAATRRHREMLVVACVVVALAFLLNVRADDRVAFGGLADYPLPPACASNTWFGVKCPGCGLTRSFVYLAHGDWSAAWRCHRLGWLLAAAVLLQFPYRAAALSRPGRKPFGVRLPKVIAYALIAALIGNWLYDVLVA